jgi:hypothetical protein
MACFVPSPRRWFGADPRWLLRVAGPVWIAASSLGCERKAPGPDECVAFAEAWMRARRPATPLDADNAFDELVRRCLTEPYDRELVACVVEGQNQDRCRVDYARRKEALREESAR